MKNTMKYKQPKGTECTVRSNTNLYCGVNEMTEDVSKKEINQYVSVLKKGMLKVYIAGKLNDSACNYISNVHAMITTANRLRLMGHSPYVPCLDLLTGLVIGNLKYSDYFENNLPWLKCADCLYIMPNSEQSSGTQDEIKLARLYDIPVITDINELRRKEWRNWSLSKI